MGWYEELQNALHTAKSQVANSAQVPAPHGIDTKVIHFSKNFQQTSKARGLTEADAKDVYYHGEAVKRNMYVRKYNGYEIGIYSFVAPDTGQPIITSIWKRERR